MAHPIPRAITHDLGTLLDQIATFGFTVTRTQYSAEAFGNYVVELHSNDSWFCITRDRGQYLLDGPKEDLGSRLLGAFDDRAALEHFLVPWLRDRAV